MIVRSTPPPAAEPTRPALRYLGGKWMLAPWIISYFPPHRIYAELFGGAASVLLRKPRAFAELYNDMDSDLVGLFRVLRDERLAAELIHKLMLTPFARDEFTGTYELTGEPVEDARRLVVRSFMGHGSNAANRFRNTGFRADSNSSGTSPARDWSNFPEAMWQLVHRVRGVVVENRPAVEILRKRKSPKALVYLDPPYVHSTRSGKQIRGALYNAYRHEMTDDDHAELLTEACASTAMVVISGYDNPLYDAMLADWTRVQQPTWADGGKARTEMLWINRVAVKAGALTQPHPEPPHPDLFESQ